MITGVQLNMQKTAVEIMEVSLLSLKRTVENEKGDSRFHISSEKNMFMPMIVSETRAVCSSIQFYICHVCGATIISDTLLILVFVM